MYRQSPLAGAGGSRRAALPREEQGRTLPVGARPGLRAPPVARLDRHDERARAAVGGPPPDARGADRGGARRRGRRHRLPAAAATVRTGVRAADVPPRPHRRGAVRLGGAGRRLQRSARRQQARRLARPPGGRPRVWLAGIPGRRRRARHARRPDSAVHRSPLRARRTVRRHAGDRLHRRRFAAGEGQQHRGCGLGSARNPARPRPLDRRRRRTDADRVSGGTPLYTFSGSIRFLRFSPDGKRLAFVQDSSRPRRFRQRRRDGSERHGHSAQRALGQRARPGMVAGRRRNLVQCRCGRGLRGLCAPSRSTGRGGWSTRHRDR